MTPDWIVYACLALGLSTALVAGVFGAFSDFIMRGLLRAHPAGGIESMQHINRTVMRSEFLIAFFALVPLSIGLAVYAWFNLEGAGQRFLLAAPAVYVVTSFLVTALGNVPMNERLARMTHTSAEAADYWRTYGRVWTRWNHVRTIGTIATAGCFLLAAVSFA